MALTQIRGAFARTRQCLLIQFSEPFSQRLSAGKTGHAALTVWVMDSKQRQDVADPRSQIHRTPPGLADLIEHRALVRRGCL